MQPQSGGPGGRAPILSLLQDLDFRVIWGVGGLSEVARWMEQLVLSLFIWEATGSPFQLGLVLVFNNLPRPIFSPFTGLIADRISRRRVLLVAQAINTATAGAVVALIAADLIQPWQIFLAVSIQGVTRSLEDPSRRTGILDVVGERRLVNALSLDVVTNTAGKLIGPITGGVLVETVGFAGAALCILVVHVINLGVMTRLRIPYRPGAIPVGPVWSSLGVAARYALRNPMLLGMLYITIVMNALAFPARQFIPAIGTDHLRVGAGLVGLLVAAESFGQLAGAAAMALTRNVQFHGRVFMVGSVVVLAMAMLFVWSPWYVLTFALLAIGGFGQAGFSTMQSAITMLSAPPEMRGRMMGVLSVCIGTGTPLGTLEIGAMAALFTVQHAISFNALAGLLLMVPAVLLTPLAWRPLTQPPPAAKN